MPYYYEKNDLDRLATPLAKSCLTPSFADLIVGVKSEFGQMAAKIAKLAQDTDLDQRENLMIDHFRVSHEIEFVGGTPFNKIVLEIWFSQNGAAVQRVNESELLLSFSEDSDTAKNACLRELTRLFLSNHWMCEYPLPEKDEDLKKYDFKGDPGWAFTERLHELGTHADLVGGIIKSEHVRQDRLRDIKYEMENRCASFGQTGLVPEHTRIGLTAYSKIVNGQEHVFIGELKNRDRAMFGGGGQPIFQGLKDFAVGTMNDDDETIWNNLCGIVAEFAKKDGLQPEKRAKMERLLLPNKHDNDPIRKNRATP